MAGRDFDAGRGGRLLACVAFCLALAPLPATADPAPGEAGPIYDPSTVAVIDLTLSPAAIDELEEDPDEYVKGAFALTFTDGTPGGEGETIEPASQIGIRLKGKIGSFRPLTEKAGFKLKFNEYAKQRVLGLKKLTLNNMVQDPSMIHETLTYAVFRAAGVPAPRTGYAYVRVNGEDFGVYLDIEVFDDVGLERWFGEFDDSQHLYEGEYGADVTPAGAAAFSVDEGDEDVRTDLEALIAAVAGGGSPFSDRVDGLADLGEMTRMWAAEKYVGHWDGYAGAGSSMVGTDVLPNNFYLFSDAAGEFQMLPWGTDQTWSRRLDFGAEAGLLFDECLADPSCWALYRDSLVAVGEAVETLDLDSLAQTTVELLGPWQGLGASREEHGLGKVEEGVAETRSFVDERPAGLAAWLGAHREHEPPPKDPEVESAGGGQPSAQEPPAEQLARAAMRVNGFAVDDGVLITRLRLQRPGTVSQVARIQTAEGVLDVCSIPPLATGKGWTALRCELSAAARGRLRKRWLRFGLRTAFAPAEGTAEAVVRRIRVRRSASG